jgi:hypothetical protein
MLSSNFLEFQPSQYQCTVRGFWRLAPGHVLSLQPRQAGLLRVAQGEVWVTLGLSQHGAGNESGDHFLHAGEQLAVSPGQHLVLEPIARAGQPPTYFEWTPVSEATRTSATQNASAVTLPLRDLGFALSMVGVALGHLYAGLVVYGRQLVSIRLVAVQAQPCSH